MFDIAIPACMAADRLSQTLAAIRKNSGHLINKLVVSMDRPPGLDHDRDAEACAEICSLHGATMVRPERWTYMAGNWNRAISETTSELVIVMNDDVTVTPGWLFNAASLPEVSWIGAAGFSVRQMSPAWPHARRVYGYGHGQNETHEACWFAWPTGPAFVMRRSMWARRGGFTEDTQMLESEVAQWCFEDSNPCVMLVNTPLLHEWNVSHRLKGAVPPPEYQQGAAHSRASWKRRYGYDYDQLSDNDFLRAKWEVVADLPWPAWIDGSFEPFLNNRW